MREVQSAELCQGELAIRLRGPEQGQTMHKVLCNSHLSGILRVLKQFYQHQAGSAGALRQCIEPGDCGRMITLNVSVFA